VFKNKYLQEIYGVLGLFGVLAGVACAQGYPAKPIRIITSPPGGGNDLPARLVAQGISGGLGQQVVVDNRPTILVSEIVAKSAPDGYTLLVSGTPHWIAPLIETVNYDPIGDFAPISTIDRSPVILVVHPSLPVRIVKELIALAKAKPGELNYATGAPGGSNHLGGLLFNHMAGVNIVRVPYKGSGPGLTALMSGEVQVMFPSAGGGVPHVRSGRLRALGVSSAEPSPIAPGVPAIAQSGVPGYVTEALHALYAPAGTPAAVVARLNREVRSYLESAQAKQTFLKSGIEAYPGTPDELMNLMKSEMANVGKVLKAAGIGVKK
jgi:tripartite-type tricarboxylate transporter receptor subunit TctC